MNDRYRVQDSNINGLTLCGGVLVNVDFTCRKSVRLVMSNLAGHLNQLATNSE